jgi:AraC-like DNA-binding protein
MARDLLASPTPRRIPLAEAARVAGLSKFHFLRLFRQAFGETPREFHTRLRLERACDLLEQRRDLTVSEVCFEVGFASLGSFSSLFARQIGTPPSSYRARHLVMIPERLVSRRIPGCFLLRFAPPSVSQF